MIHLASAALRPSARTQGDTFPFNVPTIASLDKALFETPVTFLVGENGSGKSTFLEALAAAARLPAVGAEDVNRDPTLAQARHLAQHVKLAWTKRTHRGFFLRAEDFFGFAKRMAQIQTEMQAELAAIEDEYADRSEFAKAQARMAYAGQIEAIQSRYGDGLDARSHGESFLQLFQSRFVPDGLYLLDEPEAPLSPLRQVGFLSLLQEMVQQDAQFIVATHSPILMAYPGATLLDFDQTPIAPVAWDKLEHVTITRSFLNDPELYLRHL